MKQTEKNQLPLEKTNISKSYKMDTIDKDNSLGLAFAIASVTRHITNCTLLSLSHILLNVKNSRIHKT